MDKNKIIRTLGPYLLNARIVRAYHLLFEFLFRMANLPIIRRFHPWMHTDKTKLYWIPVNESLERKEDVVLPYNIVEEFIEKSSYRAIMDLCGCRFGHRCQEHPVDLGCLMMGEDAKKIPYHIAHPASKEEARAHLQRAIKVGLPTIIGKARIDNFLFNVPDQGKLLSVCFCCECCCVLRFFGYLPPQERKELMPRLPGLEVSVKEEVCVGCGVCADHCFLHLIEIKNGKAYIPEDCRGCGRCARYCPQSAIQLKLDNPQFINQAVSRIEKYFDPSV